MRAIVVVGKLGFGLRSSAALGLDFFFGLGLTSGDASAEGAKSSSESERSALRLSAPIVRDTSVDRALARSKV